MMKSDTQLSATAIHVTTRPLQRHYTHYIPHTRIERNVLILFTSPGIFGLADRTHTPK